MAKAEQLCANSSIAWHEATDSQALAEQLASRIAQSLQQRIDSAGNASLVVSGGSTPAPVFKRLAEFDLAWAQVAVTLADERWVAPDDDESNERLVRQTLLTGRAVDATFVSLYRQGMEPEQALEPVGSAVSAMAQPFTVVILGMGTDGHTASLFPDAPRGELQAAMDLSSDNVVSVLRPPSVSQARITLTRAALLRSETRLLHITGEQKKKVLEDALLESCFGNDGVEAVPGSYTEGMKPVIGLLTEQSKSASVYWSP